ncbi:MAG: DEAD/DEAH box helicase [Candidatus Poribacteria bacterium]|nr:DEAD/DEAH box helicase [Candidatus Poribacteria bacterium]
MLYKGLVLDQFQEEAIAAIDRDHSVIVAAPTGAGKTVIAEYAVEKCLQTNKRVIYTAPIKALSNQKYRDFQAEYGDKIGIITGDVVLNPYAQVLLMTTEIFRNIIFDDIERLNDISYVIFDEIHYINDTSRGTVWEESIIFAPQHIKFVCLSATIPDINSFTEWMQSVREIDIKVVEELERPVPLEHHFYFRGFGIGKLGHLYDLRQIAKQRQITKQKKRKDTDQANDIPKIPKSIIDTKLIPYLKKQNRLPCLYFCFSRRKCESNARYYTYARRRHDLLDKEQQEQILEKFDALCIQFDIVEEKAVTDFRKLISCGVAYHHAGMLPTLKEVVERLFTSGLIQLLYTTETFAVGINMPACTVVFDSLEKYDGVRYRYLKTREYHQMAGRAGRRGIDTVGYVYAQVNPKFASHAEVSKVVSDTIEPTTSQFNLSYASILNLYEKYGDEIYDVYTMSLSNHQNYKRTADLNKQIALLDEKGASLPLPTCIHDNIDGMKQIESYHRLKHSNEKSLERLQFQLASLKSRAMWKKSGKKEQEKKVAPIHNEVEGLNAEISENLCHECYQRKQCTKKYQAIRKNEQYIQNLKKKQVSIQNYQQEQIAARLNVLETLGYIEPQALLPRGKTASHIYGYELQLTQLLFKGFFERLTEDEINCLVVSIVSEPRKDGYYKKIKDKRFLSILGAAWDEILNIQRLESQLNVSGITPALEPRLCSAMLAWSRGCEFDELTDYATLDPGDFIRSFRVVIDQLRQIRRAMTGHTALTDKLNLCIGKINRDVIDAERQLRIGQEEPFEEEDDIPNEEDDTPNEEDDTPNEEDDTPNEEDDIPKTDPTLT